jgi:filamentous hemagglutinin
MFNLTVSEAHTYYVGQEGWLVHNGEGCLVGANRALIDSRKLSEYALNPNHSVGKDKAKVFQSALGYNQSNYADLLQQIKRGLPENTPIPGAIDKFGTRFAVDIPVTGPGGTAVVRTAWIYRPGSLVPELTSLYVKPK